MITFALEAPAGPGDTAPWQPYWVPTATDQAWRLWQIASCVERHGGHLWELELDHPEDGACVSLWCSYCPMTADDWIIDGHDLVWLEFGGVTVVSGRHNSPVPLTVPVHAEPWSSKSWTDYGWEYDAGIDVEQRGPARAVDA